MNRPYFVRPVRCLVLKENGQDQEFFQRLNDLCASVRFVRSLVKRTGGQQFIRFVPTIRTNTLCQTVRNAHGQSQVKFNGLVRNFR